MVRVGPRTLMMLLHVGAMPLAVDHVGKQWYPLTRRCRRRSANNSGTVEQEMSYRLPVRLARHARRRWALCCLLGFGRRALFGVRGGHPRSGFLPPTATRVPCGVRNPQRPPCLWRPPCPLLRLRLRHSRAAPLVQTVPEPPPPRAQLDTARCPETPPPRTSCPVRRKYTHTPRRSAPAANQRACATAREGACDVADPRP